MDRHPVMSPFVCPASGSATQAMYAAETWANCWKHFSHNRAEGFDQTQDLQDMSCIWDYYTACGEHNIYNSVVSAKQLRATASGIKWGRQQ